MEPGAFVETTRHLGVSELVGLLLSYFLLSVTFLNLAKITFEMYIQLFLFKLWLVKNFCVEFWMAHEILHDLFSNIEYFKAKALP